MPVRQPFGDYSTIDLSSIYANAGAGGAGGGGTTTGGGTTGGGNPATGPAGYGSPITTAGSAGDPQAPGGSWAASSPQASALSAPGASYLDTSTSGGIAFTPAQARAWWDQWFAHPVNLLGVAPELLPGTLSLTPEEVQKARDLQASGTLAVPQGVYNPLNLTIDAGSGPASYGASGGWGGYGSAQAALSAAHPAAGTPAATQYTNTLAQYPAATTTGTGGSGAAASPPPASTTTTSGGVGVENGVASHNLPTGGPIAAAQPPPDYAALAATDRKYAANLAASDPARSKMYLDRATEYDGRVSGASSGSANAVAGG